MSAVLLCWGGEADILLEETAMHDRSRLDREPAIHVRLKMKMRIIFQQEYTAAKARDIRKSNPVSEIWIGA